MNDKIKLDIREIENGCLIIWTEDEEEKAYFAETHDEAIEAQKQINNILNPQEGEDD